MNDIFRASDEFHCDPKKKNANQEQICDAIYDYISDVPVSCYSSISISAI